MKSRRLHFSEDPQTICRRRSRLSADELLSNIPIDLVIDIFSRLPLNSIARCRCVSKLWASTLRRPDFTELFLAKSLARPQLLFAYRKGESELIFFSLPQPQNLDENVSFISADHHITFPFERVDYIFNSFNGYVCITDERILKGRKTPELVWVICNPSTGQSFTSPKLKKMKGLAKHFLAYDPIEKQHKVLAVSVGGIDAHQVLTLQGTRNLTWRMIECSVPHHYPGPKCICIDGVLYYSAWGSGTNGHILVCFDVRSEKYSSVKAMERSLDDGTTLVNYNGKLALLRAQPNAYAISGTSTSSEMWILDLVNHEWSSRIFKLPRVWKDVVAEEVLLFQGVAATNEIVLSPKTSSDLYYVYHYNFDKKTINRVKFQGMRPVKKGWGSGVFTLLNHVEDVKLM